jgi:DsbC/DsbD-like thiol-disulfide interchange protein
MLASSKTQRFCGALAPSTTGCAALLAALCLATEPALAQSASSWVKGPLSSVRLISGGLQNGVWRAGVEISLKSGAHTYWRFPGDSGVPPTFDFAGSANLKDTRVSFPLPERLDEAGMQIFGYKSDVVFPLAVTPNDASKPVVVALHFQYAACEKICMPAEARLKFTLDPRNSSKANLARIEQFAARVPKPLGDSGSPLIKVAAGTAGEKKTWQVSIEPAGGKAEDLIAEGPDGWIFDTKRQSPGRFLVTLAEKPTDATGKTPPVTLTVVTDKGAFEGVRHLDAGGATP